MIVKLDLDLESLKHQNIWDTSKSLLQLYCEVGLKYYSACKENQYTLLLHAIQYGICTLQASGTKLLAESGKDKFFSCGMSLTHSDILDSTKWKSNMLGKLQMEIRDKLNKS